MSSPAQVAANRRNSQLSTGPRTAEGKYKVSLNSTSHGLSGAHLILPGEDPAQFDALLAGLRSEHSPAGITEDFLVQQMAHAHWKLLRIASMETEMFTPNPELQQRLRDVPPAAVAAAMFQDDCAGANSLPKLSRYEASTRRAWFQSLKQLTALQKARNSQPAREEEIVGAAESPEAPLPPPQQQDAAFYKTKPIGAQLPPASDRIQPAPVRINAAPGLQNTTEPAPMPKRRQFLRK